MLVRERLLTPSGDDDRPGARRLAARRGVVGVLAGALIMLLAATGLAATGADLAFLGLSSSEGTGAAGTGDPGVADGGETAAGAAGGALTADPGRCLTWRRDDASDVAEVACTRAHLFEGVGTVAVAQPPGAPFPADEAWQQIVTDQCTPKARDYLGGKLDPAGRYQAGALKPSPTAWGSGDRTVRCGLQAPGSSGALYTSTGRVRDADQARVFPAGTCLALAGKQTGDPVDCTKRHAAEVAGTVDLSEKFTGGLPTEDDQDNHLFETCQKVATDRVGQQKLTDSKLTVYWSTLGAESWDAGTRRVDCRLGSLLADGSGFAPLTGTAADGVTIGGDAPAEPDPLPRPGAPADEPGALVDPGDAAAGDDTPAGPGEGTDPGVSSSAPGPAPALPLPLPLPGSN